jgi:hypothetical protein
MMPLRGGKGLKEIVKSFDKVKLRAYAPTRLAELKKKMKNPNDAVTR